MIHKIFLRHAMALGVVLTVLVARPDSLAAQSKHGDVNGDGLITALDAQAILTYVVGLPLPAGYIAGNGDATCTAGAHPTALDAQVVLTYVIGLPTSQYCIGAFFGQTAVKVAIAPRDSSVLINRTIVLKATVKDTGGFFIKRPIGWSSSAPNIAAIDSVRNDTVAFVRGAAAGTANITANSDGASFLTSLKVFLSYAGIAITPQRPDTMRQLNGVTTFVANNRDSLGNFTSVQAANWSTKDTTIAKVDANGNVTALSNGATLLRAQSKASSTVWDSTAISVAMAPVNACSGTGYAPIGGTLHPTATYTTAQTWSPTGNPHYVTGNLTFNSGANLTIQPGTLVCTASGVQLYFKPGARLIARGTAAQLIAFKPTTPTDIWQGIQLGDYLGYPTTAPTDTSFITNATFERMTYGIMSREQHRTEIDSVRIRQSYYYALQLYGQGSRFSRGRIDSVQQTGNIAVRLGRGKLEASSVRSPGSYAVSLEDAAIVTNDSIVGATTAINQNSYSGTASLTSLTISGTTAVALSLPYAQIDTASKTIKVTGGTAGVFSGQIGNFGVLFPDSTRQEVLKNNGKDTVFITSGGTAKNAIMVVRSDLPWVVNNYAYVDTLAQVVPSPGASVLFNYGALYFQHGGTLNAVGTPTKFIKFQPYGTAGFYGLAFDNPGPGANPALAPIATSTLSYVRLDSASGLSATGICCNFAIAGGDHHKVLVDSAIVHKAWYGAVGLGAKGSVLKRSLIDTTGYVGSNYTTSYDAVLLGDSTSMQNSLVRGSGSNNGAGAVNARGSGVVLSGVRIVASKGFGLRAENATIATSLGGVRADSANAQPYRGLIQNLAALAPDTASQKTAFIAAAGVANTLNVLEIAGGTLAGTPGTNTPSSPFVMGATSLLKWRVTSYTYIDTLAQLAPGAGSQFRFTCCSFTFQHGGTLKAIGSTMNRIWFRPDSLTANSNFYGLDFESPGPGPTPSAAPFATSTLSYVQVDSASGVYAYTGFGYSAAINTGDHHKLTIDSLVVRKAYAGAVYLAASGSQLSTSRIDTTGNIASAYTSYYAAIQLGNGALMQTTRVLRSGQVGVYTYAGARLSNVRIVGSLGVGLQADNGVLAELASDIGTVKADSANAQPFKGLIQNLAQIAPDTNSQKTSFIAAAGVPNTSNILEITGGTLAGTPSSPTLVMGATGLLRWRVTSTAYIDTLAQLAPGAGAQFRFTCCGFTFQRGGTLNAVGSTTKRILFKPDSLVANATFYGLEFENAGAQTGVPSNIPVTTSTLSYVQLDSASGVYAYSGFGYSAAINTGDHYKLMIDSLYVRKAYAGAVYLAAAGSQLSASRIDTTGTIGTMYTSSYPAIQLGNGALMQTTRVFRSGQVGVSAYAGARLFNVRIVGSLGVGVEADNGVLAELATDVGTVKADSANAQPFKGRIENLAQIAPDTNSQKSAFIATAGTANTNNILEITGGTLTGTPVTNTPSAPFIVGATKSLLWKVTGYTYIDSLARLVPGPGARLQFGGAGLVFQNGGTLVARGTSTDSIHFERFAPGSFAGLYFNNPSAATAVDTSIMNHVRVTDINSYQCASNGCGAITAEARHVVRIDTAWIRQSYLSGVVLSAPGSHVFHAKIDTTGTGGGYPAVVLAGHNMWADSSVFHGNTYWGVRIMQSDSGVHVTGDSIFKSSVGIRIENTATSLSLTRFFVIGSSGNGVEINASGVSLSSCDVGTSGGHGFTTLSSLSGVTISQCNIESNTLRGVNNNDTVNSTNIINATSNWWGAGGVPAVGAPNGPSANVTTATPLGIRRSP